ncbi:MAG: prepilin peptidase, partial [Planctomycetia bacterium]
MDIISTLQPGAVIFILVGVTFLGGAIGSFLNVVIYRLPVGQSLIRPPSHCPRCEHPIRPYDNIPVFGWLLLRGKCRDCGEPISARYPVIEAIVAVMFLVVVWVEWFGLKSPWAFPMNAVAANPDLATAGSGPSFLLVAVRTVAHLVLLVTLLGAGMIEWDQKRVPRSIWYPAIVTSVSWWLILMVLGRAGMSELFLASVLAGVGGGGFIFLIDKLRIKV